MDLIQKVREHAEREWGASAHSRAVTKAVGRHWQSAKDEARAGAFAEILRILDGKSPPETVTRGDESETVEEFRARLERQATATAGGR